MRRSGADDLLSVTFSHGSKMSTQVLYSLHKHFPATSTRSLCSRSDPHLYTVRQSGWASNLQVVGLILIIPQMPFVKKVKSGAYFSRFQVKYRRRREGKTDCKLHPSTFTDFGILHLG